MKKFIMMTMALAMLLAATSCASCNKEKQDNTSMVEQTVTSDYDYMSDNYADFVWYESQITLDKWLDSSNTANVTTVANVFQYIADEQPHVIIFTHYGTKCDTTRYNDIWIEDCAMSPAELGITFDQAYDRLMQSNYPKPHSIKCVLRKPLGPYDCNPQYIFGNISYPLFVDAVYGTVSASNPAFNKRECQPDDGVLMEAIRVSKDWNAVPCGGCNIGSVQAWRELLQYVRMSPMQAATPGSWDKSDPQRCV